MIHWSRRTEPEFDEHGYELTPERRRHNLRSWGINAPEPLPDPIPTPPEGEPIVIPETIDPVIDPLTETRYQNLFEAYRNLAERHQTILARYQQGPPGPPRTTGIAFAPIQSGYSDLQAIQAQQNMSQQFRHDLLNSYLGTILGIKK